MIPNIALCLVSILLGSPTSKAVAKCRGEIVWVSIKTAVKKAKTGVKKMSKLKNLQSKVVIVGVLSLIGCGKNSNHSSEAAVADGISSPGADTKTWWSKGVTSTRLLHKADIKVERVEGGWFSDPMLKVQMEVLLNVPGEPADKIVSIFPKSGNNWSQGDKPLSELGKAFNDFEPKFVKKINNGRELWSAHKEVQVKDVWSGRNNYPVQKLLFSVTTKSSGHEVAAEMLTLDLRESGVVMTSEVWQNGHTWDKSASKLCVEAIGRTNWAESQGELVYRVEGSNETQTEKLVLTDPNGLYNAHPYTNPKGKFINTENDKSYLVMYKACIPINKCVNYVLRHKRGEAELLGYPYSLDDNFGETYRYCPVTAAMGDGEASI